MTAQHRPLPLFDSSDPRQLAPRPQWHLAPAMYADRDGNCVDCHQRPVVPYHPRCQGCILKRVSGRGGSQ